MRVPADGCGELPVPTYELYAGTEVLGGDGARAVLAGVSTRCYPVGLEASSPRRRPRRSPPVSREFVAMTETVLAQLLAADLTGLELVALLVDGVRFGESCCVVALGIHCEEDKHR
jgi:putative transposase